MPQTQEQGFRRSVPTMNNTRCRIKLSCAALFRNLFLLLVCQRTAGVIVSNITLVTETNRTNYALQGEAITLHCNYATAPEETVSSVRWEWKRRGSEEGTEVYVWRPGRKPVSKEIFFGRTDVSNNEPGFIVIRQAHMEMEGRYTCLVQTNQMTAHTEFSLIVIVDACKENVWNTSLNIDECTETIHMHCVGLFPKPTPSCGVYKEGIVAPISSVPFDKVVTLRNSTYTITLNRMYSIRDWANYPNISFRCYFTVDGTTWKRGISYKLFGAPGCSPTPPSPGPGTYNMSEEKSCWGKPREGATVNYTCNANKHLKGPETLVCRNGVWAPDPSWDGPVRQPTCNIAKILEQPPIVIAASFLVMLWATEFPKL